MITMIEQDDAAEIPGQLDRILQMQEMAQEHGSHNTKPNRPRSRRKQRTEHGTKRSPQHGAPQTPQSQFARLRSREISDDDRSDQRVERKLQPQELRYADRQPRRQRGTDKKLEGR